MARFAQSMGVDIFIERLCNFFLTDKTVFIEAFAEDVKELVLQIVAMKPTPAAVIVQNIIAQRGLIV